MFYIKEVFIAMLILVRSLKFNDAQFTNINNDINTSMSPASESQNYSAVAPHLETGSSPKDVDFDPGWLSIVNDAQAVMLVAGVTVNIFTIITLKLNGKAFTPLINAILTHQSVIDGIVCVSSIINLVTVPNSLVGANWFSLFICQAWHSQGIYWSLTWVSIANLQVFALERYIATCFPFKHSSFTRKTLYKIIPALYPVGFLVNIFGYIQVRYEAGECLRQFYWSSELFHKLMIGHAYWCFLIYWAIPTTGFICLYGGILCKLYARRKQKDLAQSRVLDTAARQLTRTSMVVTLWFIVALGTEANYYLLGFNGVVKYVKNSAVQKFSVFLSASYSCIHPVLYFLFMPAFRRSCRDTLGCRKKEENQSKSKPSINVNDSSINPISDITRA